MNRENPASNISKLLTANKDKLNIIVFNFVAIIVGLLISTVLLAFMKINPLEVCGKAFVKIFTDKYNMGEILVKATPFIFTSLAFAFTYQANLFNIGAQGQFYVGSIVAITLSLNLAEVLPTFVLLPLVLISSFLAASVVGVFLGFVKSRFNANEFLTSMMSTYVINAFMDYLLRTSLQETKAEYMQTDPIAASAYLPAIIPGTRVHFGFIIAGLTAIAVWFLLNNTSLGFKIRAVGMNKDAAKLAGINIGAVFIISFSIAAGLAGMAGFTEVNGVQHMLLRNFNSSVGSYGIGIAILANGNPIGCIFSSILFGFLHVMGITMGRLPGTSIPASIIELIEGIVMLTVIISFAIRHKYDLKNEKKKLKSLEKAKEEKNG